MSSEPNFETTSGLKRPIQSDPVEDPNLADTVDKLLKLDEVTNANTNTRPNQTASRILDRRKSSTDRPLTECEIVDLLKKMKRYHRSGGNLTALVSDIQSVGLNGEDWRENPVVLQEIFDRLPAKDIKSVRFVCKLWSIVAAVPLSYKTRATSKKTQKEEVEGRRSYARGLSCRCVTSYFDYLDSKTLCTGIRLRHVELLHKNDQYWTRSIEETWTELFQSEHFETVVSLRVYGCPADVVTNLLLPCYLPLYWGRLKLLKIYGNRRRQDVEVKGQGPDSRRAGLISSTELEALGLDVAMTNEFDWGFLRFCPNLKRFRLTVRETAEDDRNAAPVRSDKFEIMLQQVVEGLRPMYLEELKLAFEANTVVGQDIPPVHQTFPAFLSSWKTFLTSLVSSNALSLRRISVRTNMDPVHIDRFSSGLPLPGQLDSVKFYFIGDLDPWTQRLPDYQLFKNLQSRGYLNVQRLEISMVEQTRFQKLKVVVGNDKRRLVVQVGAHTYAPENFDLSTEFQALLSQEFPSVNYVCWPKQRVLKEEQILDTVLHERVGKARIFELTNLHQEWDSLASSAETASDKKSDIIEPDFVRTNAMDGPLNWTSDDLIEPNASVYIFEHISDLNQAWTTLKSSECMTSTTVEEDFNPALVLNGEGTYAFRREFSRRLTSGRF